MPPTIGPRVAVVGPRPRAPKPAANGQVVPTMSGDRVLARPVPGALRPALDDATFHNKVTLHVSADSAREAILDAIRTSESSFYIEMFIWHNDGTGREVAQALIDRKRRAEAEGKPFDAKVLIDWSGLRNATNPTKDTELFAFLKDNGIDAKEFNKGLFDPLARGHSPLTHRKLFIADGKKFLSGGRNIGDEYMQPTFVIPGVGRENAWHDLMFTVEGDETSRVTREFFRNWVRAGGESPGIIPKAPPAVGGTARVQSVVTDPRNNTMEIRDAHRRLILGAKKEIRIAYPYLSDDALIDALKEAKRANPALDVQIILPGKPQRGFPGLIYGSLNLETARQLMEVGISVRFLAQRPNQDQSGRVTAFSHFKAMAIDGRVLSIGSANGDARTLAHNHELNCLIDDPATAATFINEVLAPDWRAAKPYTQADIDAIPFWKRWFMRALEALDFMF